MVDVKIPEQRAPSGDKKAMDEKTLVGGGGYQREEDLRKQRQLDFYCGTLDCRYVYSRYCHRMGIASCFP